MRDAEFERGRSFVVRLEKGRDLLGQLTEYCDARGIDAAQVTVIGAVTYATMGFYDQDEEEYGQKRVDEPMEIIQASGNVSYLDGDRFVHLHGTFCQEDGSVVAGHLFEGSEVFAGEAVIHELKGPRLNRVHDEATGLTLWDLDEPDPS